MKIVALVAGTDLVVQSLPEPASQTSRWLGGACENAYFEIFPVAPLAGTELPPFVFYNILGDFRKVF